MKIAGREIRRLVVIQVLLSFCWFSVPFLLWNPWRTFEYVLPIIYGVPGWWGMLCAFPIAMALLVTAQGLRKRQDWARRWAIRLHFLTVASVFLAFVIGLALTVYLFMAATGDSYAFSLLFIGFVLPIVIGVAVLLPSGIFSLVAFFYLRRPSVKQQFGDSQRPFQFSLRGLLCVSVFGTAYFLGFAGWTSWQSNERSIAILGGSFSYSEDGDLVATFVSPFDDRRLKDAIVQLRQARNLREIVLESTQVGDDGLECLQGLSRLETLYLSGTKVTDAGLKHLYPLKRLKYVGLLNTAITRKGAMSLQRAIPGIEIHRDATLADLEDDNPRLRIKAIHNIREDRSAEVLAALIRALEDRHHGVQGAAAKALRYVGHADPTAAVKALIALLDRSLSSPDTAGTTQSDRHQVIAHATRSLGSLGSHKPVRSQVVSKLVSLLYFPSRLVRYDAVRALRWLDPQAAVGALIAALDSKDADLLDQLPLLFSALDHHRRAAIPELLKREKDARPEVQAAVKQVLRRLDPDGRERRKLNELGQEGT